MNRFWLFPLLIGIVGAAYFAFCTLQMGATSSFLYCCLGTPLPTSWHEVGRRLNLQDVLRMWNFWSRSGFAIGFVAGLIAAGSEWLRFGTSDRNGHQATKRLLKNGLWIGIYALLANNALWLVTLALYRYGLVSMLDVAKWYLRLSFFAFAGVNIGAIVWVVVRTVTCDDVLTPRVLVEKMRCSANLMG